MPRTRDNRRNCGASWCRKRRGYGIGREARAVRVHRFNGDGVVLPVLQVGASITRKFADRDRARRRGGVQRPVGFATIRGVLVIGNYGFTVVAGCRKCDLQLPRTRNSHRAGGGGDCWGRGSQGRSTSPVRRNRSESGTVFCCRSSSVVNQKKRRQRRVTKIECSKTEHIVARNRNFIGGELPARGPVRTGRIISCTGVGKPQERISVSRPLAVHVDGSVCGLNFSRHEAGEGPIVEGHVVRP